MSEIEQGSEGYPEETPPGTDPGAGDGPDETPAREHAEDAPDNDDGKATARRRGTRRPTSSVPAV